MRETKNEVNRAMAMVRVSGMGNADDEKHGQKNDDRGDRRREDGHGDLAGGVHDGIPPVPIDVQMALNVFLFDDGVIDQASDAER